MGRKALQPTRTVKWRVRVLMAENDIRSVSELSRLLESEVGITISVSQLGRLIDGKSQYWSQELIEGFMTIFRCDISDLFTTTTRK